jgi:hypothetical protein
MHVFEASTEVKNEVSLSPSTDFQHHQSAPTYSRRIGVEHSGYIGHPLVHLHTYSLCCDIPLIDFKVY